MKVYATDVDGLNEFWSAHRAQKERDMAKNTIQHDQKIQAKRERDARVKREKRAALKAQEADSRQGIEDAKIKSGGVSFRRGEPVQRGDARMQTPCISTPAEADEAFGAGMPMAGAAKQAIRFTGAPDGPAPSFSVKVGGVEKLKQPSLDEPVPVRLTLTGLAKAFEDACSEVAIQEGVLDHALQLRAKARKALDNAADRLANGDA